MSSSVYYKFKSQRQESRVTFDGTGISVFDLKKEIILQNNLKASDIDLLLFDNADQGKQALLSILIVVTYGLSIEYKDDSFIIPRSTSVISKRMPASRPGKGRAAIYVAHMGTSGNGKNEDSGGPNSHVNGNYGGSGGGGGMSSGGRFGAMSKRFDGRDQRPQPPSGPGSSSGTPQPQSAPAPIVAPPATGDDEAAAIAAMFSETSEQWEQTQEKMAQSRPIYNRPFVNNRPAFNNSGGGRPHHQPDTRPLPPGYICHRCNKKGHWIQDCPTNDDREYDNRPRVKRTTGIPRSFLKAVDITEGPPTKGVMVTPEGGFVVAEPDSAAWERLRTKPKGLTEAEVKDRPPRDSALACPYPGCGKLLRDAVKTPCCQTLYCEDCIHTHLLDRNFECPKCKTKIPSLDKLKIDSETRAKVREYVRNAVEESRKEAEESPNSGQPTQTKTTPEPTPVKDEEFSEHQPGNDGGVPGAPEQAPYIDPQVVVTQLQAQLAQLMMMQSNPTLPPTTRLSVNGQIQQLTYQLKQAEAMRDMMNMGMGGMMNNGMNMNMMGMGNNMMGGGGMMPMNMGMGMGGQPGYHQPQQPQWKAQQPGGWNNAYQMQQQPGGDHSAYDRRPMNNRGPKRGRPEDFPEGGPDAKRQYWE